jgi:ribosome biogenesis GTPase A
VLWPRIIVAKSGYNLAASGAIGRNAFDDEEVALELLDYLRQHYPQALAARYAIADASAQTDEHLLDGVGRRRGALQSGGRVNLQKAAEIAIHDFRGGAMGRITLETPDELAQWLAAPEKMLQTDVAAKAMLKEFNNIPMPNQGLSKSEIAQYIAYFHWADSQKAGAAKADSAH